MSTTASSVSNSIVACRVFSNQTSTSWYSTTITTAAPTVSSVVEPNPLATYPSTMTDGTTMTMEIANGTIVSTTTSSASSATSTNSPSNGNSSSLKSAAMGQAEIKVTFGTLVVLTVLLGGFVVGAL